MLTARHGRRLAVKATGQSPWIGPPIRTAAVCTTHALCQGAAKCTNAAQMAASKEVSRRCQHSALYTSSGERFTNCIAKDARNWSQNRQPGSVDAVPARKSGGMRARNCNLSVARHPLASALAAIIQKHRFLQQLDFTGVMLVDVVYQCAQVVANLIEAGLFPFFDVAELRY